MYFEEEAEFLGSDFIDNLKYFFSMSYDFFQSSNHSRVKQEQEGKFPLAPMGVLAPGSAHARPSARPPIDTSGNFSAHMSGGGGGKLSDSFSDQLSRQIREF